MWWILWWVFVRNAVKCGEIFTAINAYLKFTAFTAFLTKMYPKTPTRVTFYLRCNEKSLMCMMAVCGTLKKQGTSENMNSIDTVGFSIRNIIYSNTRREHWATIRFYGYWSKLFSCTTQLDKYMGHPKLDLLWLGIWAIKFALFNCSQTKFVAIILVLSAFFLCDFLLDQFFVWRFWLFVLKNGINR